MNDEYEDMLAEQRELGRLAKINQKKQRNNGHHRVVPVTLKDKDLGIPDFFYPMSADLRGYKPPVDIRTCTIDETDINGYRDKVVELMEAAASSYDDPVYGQMVTYHPERFGFKPSPTLIAYRNMFG